MDALRSLIARKGPLFLINHLVLGTLAVWLLLRITRPDGMVEKSYLVVRVLALGCVGIFGYLSLLLGRRGNTRLLVWFAATCFAGEILMRALGSFGAGAHSDVPWREPRPYFMFGGPSDGRMLTSIGGGPGPQIRLNAEGFRIEREIANPKPADEIRIFVLGGSTVVTGGALANTVPAVIEAHLRANGLPPARVYNFGVVSFVSGQELSLLVHRLIDLKPDLVIAYDGGNDVFQPWIYDPRPGYPFNFVAWEEAMNALSNSGGAAKTIAGLTRDSALLQALVGMTDWINRIVIRQHDLQRAVGHASAPWRQAVVDIYARNIAAMCRIAGANDALFAAFFQPMLPYSKALDQRQIAMSGGEDAVQGMREQRALAPPAVAAQFAAPPVGAGCRFGDLSDFLENEPAVFDDIIHVDATINQRIGRRIAEDLLAWPALRSKRDAR